MGSCVSMHKNCMKESVLIESSNKENAVQGQELEPQLSSLANATTSRDPNSREEMFFDSNLWLESDCEDFLSVNGDFTPSRGNTPIHQSNFKQAPQLDKSLNKNRTFDSLPEPSETDAKKTLLELLYESFSGEQVDVDQNFQGTKTAVRNRMLEAKLSILLLSPKSTNGTPLSVVTSVCSNEITPNRASKPEREKLCRSVSCCLPGVPRSLSFRDRKKRLSPAYIGRK